MYKKILSIFLAIVLVLSLSVPAFADFTYSDSSNLSINTTFTTYIYDELVNIYSRLASFPTSFTTIISKLSSIELTSNNIYSRIYNDLPLKTDWKYFFDDVDKIRILVSSIESVIADPLDKATHNGAKNNQEVFNDNFLKGSNGVKTSDIGSLSNLTSGFKSFFSLDGIGGGSAPVDINSWDSVLVDDEPFSFFTDAQAVASDLGVTAGGYVDNPDPSAPSVDVLYTNYNVYYYIENTTNSVRDTKSVYNVLVGSEVTESAPTVSGYTLASSSSSSLVLNSYDNTITFYYRPLNTYSSYSVNYLIEGSSDDVLTTKTVDDVLVGSSVTEYAPSVYGYTLVSTSIQTFVVGLSEASITFYYRSNGASESEPVYTSYNVYYYLEGTSTTVATTKTVTDVLVGQTIHERSPYISGYERVGGLFADITLTDGVNYLIFYYRPQLQYNSYTVNFYLENTDTVIADPLFVDSAEVGSYFDPYTYVLNGYRYVSSDPANLVVTSGTNVFNCYYEVVIVNRYFRYNTVYGSDKIEVNNVDVTNSGSGTYLLHDNDVIRIPFKYYTSSSYFNVNVNGTDYHPNSNKTVHIYNEDITVNVTRVGSTTNSNSQHWITIAYHSQAPASLSAPLMSRSSSPVITHYYNDNMADFKRLMGGD